MFVNIRFVGICVYIMFLFIVLVCMVGIFFAYVKYLCIVYVVGLF